MKKVLLDTNIIILHLADQITLPESSYEFAVSTLTVFELLRFPGVSRYENDNIRTFLNICDQLTVTSTIAERAAFIGRTRRSNSIDLLIAATALEHHLPLITKNVKDFKRVPGLIVHETIL